MRHLLTVLLCLGLLTACEGLPQPVPPVEPIQEWQGASGTQRATLQVLAQDEEEWVTLWALAGQEPPRPFPAAAVGVGVFLGERPTGGYTLLLRANRLPGGELLVEWREKDPAGDAVVTQAITHPWVIALYPADAGKTLLRPLK